MPQSVKQIFISCVEEERDWLDRIKTHLGPRAKQRQIEVWDSLNPAPGLPAAGWRTEKLESADVAVVLLSADYLVHMADLELAPLVTRARQSTLRLFVERARSVSRPPDLGREDFPSLDPLDRPLKRLKKRDAEELVVNLVDRLLEERPQQRPTKSVGSWRRGGKPAQVVGTLALGFGLAAVTFWYVGYRDIRDNEDDKKRKFEASRKANSCSGSKNPQSEDCDKLIRFCEQDCRENRRDEHCCDWAGKVYEEQGYWSKATDLYQIACDRDIITSCLNAGKLYYDHQDFQKAEAVYKRACSLEQERGCFYLGLAQEKSDHPDDALASFIIACDYGQKEACFNACDLLEKKDRDKAGKLCRRACDLKSSGACIKSAELQPHAKCSFYERACSYEKEGSNKDKLGCKYLGCEYKHSKCGGNLTKAIDLYRAHSLKDELGRVAHERWIAHDTKLSKQLAEEACDVPYPSAKGCELLATHMLSEEKPDRAQELLQKAQKLAQLAQPSKREPREPLPAAPCDCTLSGVRCPPRSSN